MRREVVLRAMDNRIKAGLAAAARRARLGEGAAAEPAPQVARIARGAADAQRRRLRSARRDRDRRSRPRSARAPSTRRPASARGPDRRGTGRRCRCSTTSHQRRSPRARIGEAEVDHHAAVARELVEPHEAADVPHQEAGVELAALAGGCRSSARPSGRAPCTIGRSSSPAPVRWYSRRRAAPARA